MLDEVTRVLKILRQLLISNSHLLLSHVLLLLRSSFVSTCVEVVHCWWYIGNYHCVRCAHLKMLTTSLHYSFYCGLLWRFGVPNHPSDFSCLSDLKSTNIVWVWVSRTKELPLPVLELSSFWVPGYVLEHWITPTHSRPNCNIILYWPIISDIYDQQNIHPCNLLQWLELCQLHKGYSSIWTGQFIHSFEVSFLSYHLLTLTIFYMILCVPAACPIRCVFVSNFDLTRNIGSRLNESSWLTRLLHCASFRLLHLVSLIVYLDQWVYEICVFKICSRIWLI